jgi:hypothetical protein
VCKQLRVHLCVVGRVGEQDGTGLDAQDRAALAMSAARCTAKGSARPVRSGRGAPTRASALRLTSAVCV